MRWQCWNLFDHLVVIYFIRAFNISSILRSFIMCKISILPTALLISHHLAVVFLSLSLYVFVLDISQAPVLWASMCEVRHSVSYEWGGRRTKSEMCLWLCLCSRIHCTWQMIENRWASFMREYVQNMKRLKFWNERYKRESISNEKKVTKSQWHLVATMPLFCKRTPRDSFACICRISSNSCTYYVCACVLLLSSTNIIIAIVAYMPFYSKPNE